MPQIGNGREHRDVAGPTWASAYGRHREFVRYSAEIETIDPDIDELTEQIIDFWEKKVRESPKPRPPDRPSAAPIRSRSARPGRGGDPGDVTAAYAQGIYAKPGHHDALLRVSQPSDHLGMDAYSDPSTGCAIKIFDVEAPKLVDDEPQSATFDRVEEQSDLHRQHGQALSVHPGDRRHVGKYLARGKAGFHDLLNGFPDGQGHARAARLGMGELFAFVRAATQTPVSNPLLSTFSTMASVRHGDYVARSGVLSGRRQRAHAIHGELDLKHRTGRIWFDRGGRTTGARLRFRPAGPAVHGPRRDAGQRRDRGMARDAVPFVTVGRVHLPRQDISGPENSRRATRSRSTSGGSRPITDRGRDHAGATHLHRVGQDPSHAEPPAAKRAHERRRGVAVGRVGGGHGRHPLSMVSPLCRLGWFRRWAPAGRPRPAATRQGA